MAEARHGWQPFRLSRAIIFLTYKGWVVAKGRRWREDVNVFTQRLTDTGVKARLIQKYIKPK